MTAAPRPPREVSGTPGERAAYPSRLGRRPTRTGRRRLALAAALALGGLLGSAAPAGAADPIDDAYQQTALCLKDQRALDPLTNGVGWAQRGLGFNATAELSVGAGVSVAVLDTGVNALPAFGDRLVAGGDLLWSAAPQPGLDDCDGHGTLVAGILGGAADPETGFTGVAPAARIISIRDTSLHYSRTNTGGEQPSTGIQGAGVGTPDQLATAIDMAVAADAGVINISAAICGPALSMAHPGIENAVARAAAADVLVVAAAGNVGDEGNCSNQNAVGGAPVTGVLPARMESVLTVGAVQRTEAPSDFTLNGPWVDVAAPGEDLISVNPHPDRTGQVDRIVTDNGTAPISGTSYATAYVSGVAALVRARFPELSATQVAHRITVTASHPAGEDGHNDRTGAGVVSPRLALTAVLPEEGAAGRPLPLEEQGPAAGGAGSSQAPGGPGGGASPEAAGDAQADGLPPAEPSPDPFAGRTVAMIAVVVLLGTLGLVVLATYLRRRGPTTP